MKAVIVIGNNYKFNTDDFTNSFVVGVDKGALLCYENNIRMDAAVGDFDSITEEQLYMIKNSTKVIKLNPIKDETDTMEAIRLCDKYDEIVILGGISGKRIEHFYANLLLLKQNSKVKIKDDSSFIFTTTKYAKLNKDYKYVSIFSLDNETVISLKGFKYNLDKYNLKENDPLGISNEIIDDSGEILLDNGRAMVILSKNDHI